MPTTRKFYEILGLSPFASRKEITAAIARLRQKDSEGHYAATLDRIEKTLLPQKNALTETASAQTPAQKSDNDNDATPAVEPKTPAPRAEKRRRPDPALPSPSDDNATRPTVEPSLPQAEKRRRSDPALPSPPTETLAHESSSSYQYQDDSAAGGKKKIAIIAGAILIVAITVAVIIAAKSFIYDTLKTRAQAKEAAIALFEAKDRIEAYIRQYKTFPSRFTFHIADAAPYTLSLKNKRILATFNQNATAPLRNKQICLTEFDQPDLGMVWQCDVLPGFPERYHPDNCY